MIHPPYLGLGLGLVARVFSGGATVGLFLADLINGGMQRID